MAKTQWVNDPCPDVYGYTTIRPADGSEHGDTESEPIATVYDSEHARLIVQAVNCHDELLAILERFVSLCPSSEGLGGHAPVGAFFVVAEDARDIIARTKATAKRATA